MVAYNSYQLENAYINDFGQTARKITFRRSQAAPAPPNTGGLDLPEIVNNARCGGGTALYQPRYLEALLNTGTSYQYVLPDKSVLAEAVEGLLDIDSIDCVNYYGEKWSVIPDSLLISNYDREATFLLDPSNARISGNFQYQSDLSVIGFTRQPLNVMQFPEDFSALATDASCVTDFQQGGICVSSLESFKPRRFTAVAFGDEDRTKQTSREVKVSSRTGQQLLACANAIAPSVVCLKYRGEIILDVGRFLTN